MYWKHIWNTDLLENVKFMWPTFIYVLNVFSMHDIRECTNMNEWTSYDFGY
jgi:hypothetical protein